MMTFTSNRYPSTWKKPYHNILKISLYKFWVLQNPDPVLASIKRINRKNSANP